MKDLSNREIHWLIIHARDNEFFTSLHDFYKRSGHLTSKQHYYLTQGIEKAENTEEVAFLRDNADINQDLKETLEIYEENGYLEEYEYNDFIHLKVKY